MSQNLTSLKRECHRLNKIDYKKLISLLQRHKLYTLDGPQDINTISYFIDNNLTVTSYSTQKFIDTVTYEVKHTADYLLSQKQPRNYTRKVIEKQINDYLIEVNRLRNLTVDYKTAINELDTTTDIKKFEKYTQQWADTQDKINFLLKEVDNYRKLIK